MSLLDIALALIASFAVFAYVPLMLVIRHQHRVISARRRPVNDILRDAYAEGRITQERYEKLMDEVHEALPTLDAPYPLVRELKD